MRPASYRNVDRCCATCRHYRPTMLVCLHGETATDTKIEYSERFVHEHGICDEYEANEEPNHAAS